MTHPELVVAAFVLFIVVLIWDNRHPEVWRD